MHRHSCIAALLVAAVALSAPAAFGRSADTPDPRGSLRKVEQDLTTDRQRRDALEQRATALQAELAALRGTLVATAAAVQAQEAELLGAETRLRRLNATEAKMQRTLSVRRRSMVESLGALSRLSRRPQVTLVASTSSPLDTLRTARLLGAAVPAIKRDVDDLLTQLAALQDVRVDIVSEKAAMLQGQQRLDTQRRDLDALLQRKLAVQDDLDRKRADATDRIARLGERAKDLQDLVLRIEAEEARLRAVIAQQAESERQADVKREAEIHRLAVVARRAEEQRLVEARRLAEIEQRRLTAEQSQRRAQQRKAEEAAAQRRRQLDAAAPFSEARGRMPMPAQGRLVQPFGATDQLGMTVKGIRVATRKGAPVVAPYNGRIAYAGHFRGYGLLLIIAHGEGYHTILSGMSHIYGNVGQTVLAGEPIGQMGDEAEPRPILYVELRRRGEPINPIPWLAASYQKVSG